MGPAQSGKVRNEGHHLRTHLLLRQPPALPALAARKMPSQQGCGNDLSQRHPHSGDNSSQTTALKAHGRATSDARIAGWFNLQGWKQGRVCVRRSMHDECNTVSLERGMPPLPDAQVVSVCAQRAQPAKGGSGSILQTGWTFPHYGSSCLLACRLTSFNARTRLQ